MEWMQGYFGPPPLPLLTVSPIPGYFGQGFPGLIYLSTMSFLREQDRPRAARGASMQTFFSEILSAHEAAHQWWGNLVASASYHDDWIHEALANYTALMILERKKGDKPLYDTLDEYLVALRMPTQDNPSVDATGPITWGVRLHSEFAPDPWRVIIYNKGSWIMHMLRRRMGDAQFLAMLSDLRKKYEYKTLDTETFRSFAASYQPKDIPDPRLENFFDNWVYATGIPTIDVTTSVRGKAPAVQLTVTVRQSGVSDDFGVDLPLEIRTSSKAKPIVKWIRTSSDPAVVTMNLKAPPVKVELAPGAGVLATIKK
jgi:aminopeptidase N